MGIIIFRIFLDRHACMLGT